MPVHDSKCNLTLTVRKYTRLPVVVPIIALAVLSFVLAGFTDGPPHRFSDRDCPGCHATVPHEGKGRPFRLVAPVDTLCLRCHAGISSVSHHVNMSPDKSLAVPPGLPLDEMGAVNCSTCHYPHAPATDPSGGETHLLRPALSGGDPCHVCHENNLSAAGSFTHRSTLISAHWVANRDLFSGHEDAPECVYGPPGNLDSASMECLSCHDTADWSRKAQCTMIFMHGEKSGALHPLGVVYDKAAYSNEGLKKVVTDSRIVLFNGRVGCCTCHDPFAFCGGAGLRIGDADDYSQLCGACHISQG